MSLKNQRTTSDFLEWDKMQLLIHKLERDQDYRFALLIGLGSYTGLRISDLLKLTWNDLSKDKLEVTEKKTGKVRTIHLHEEVKDLISRIRNIENGEADELLFLNRFYKPISVQYINRKLKQLELKYELDIRFSTHTFRKTFGRRIWSRNGNSEKALILLGTVFNHSSISITKRYLGIREKEIQDVYLSL
jgi:integrase